MHKHRIQGQRCSPSLQFQNQREGKAEYLKGKIFCCSDNGCEVEAEDVKRQPCLPSGKSPRSPDHEDQMPWEQEGGSPDGNRNREALGRTWSTEASNEKDPGKG